MTSADTSPHHSPNSTNHGVGNTMNEIKLSTNLVNAILQYLGTRPYTEVFQVIEAIQKEAKAASEPPAE
jgi:hypothetical protein